MYINYININIYFSPVQCVLQWDISSTWGSTCTEIQVKSVYVTLKNFLKLYRSINLNVTSFYLSCLLQFSLHSQFSCLFSYNITEAAWKVCFHVDYTLCIFLLLAPVYEILSTYAGIWKRNCRKCIDSDRVALAVKTILKIIQRNLQSSSL